MKMMNLKGMKFLKGMRKNLTAVFEPILFLVVAVLLVCSGGAHATTITNPGFETTSDWTITQNGISAYYATDWSSEGTHNFTFYRGTGSISAGTYAMISQNIDMTDVTGFIFDCQDTGIDPHPLNFLIDGAIVGTWQNNGHEYGDLNTSWAHTATTYDISLDLSTLYTGVHELSVQMYNGWTLYPSDPKYYRVDNLRLAQDGSSGAPVPEPTTMLLLGTGLIGLVGWRKRKKIFRSSISDAPDA